MNATMPPRLIALVMLAALAFPARAADLVALSPQTWDRYIPQGKEVDGIYGDFAHDQRPDHVRWSHIPGEAATPT